MGANKAGELTGLDIDPDVWSEEPNSRVGEIPVYTRASRHRVASMEGFEEREYFACFEIAGYSYALCVVDYTQEEFVQMLLAIINHYGAYPTEK